MNKLNSVPEVIKAIGGRKAIADLTGSSIKAVAVWRWKGEFPAKTYIVISNALRARGIEPDISLFSFIDIPSEPERAA